jgi:hypothetical protein
MKKILPFLLMCIAFNHARSQCLASSHPTNDCSGGAAISFINIANVAQYPGGCITSDGYYYNSNAPYGFMIGATINYTIYCGITLAVAMWIDLDNNSVLSANEMILSSSPKVNHIGTFTVPKTATPFSSGKIRFRSAWNHQILGTEACVDNLGGAGDTQDYLISLFCGTLSVPAVNVAPMNPTICKGGSVTLTASGAMNYTWTPNNVYSPILSITPSVSTSYTVTGTNTNCPGSNKKTVNVSVANPLINAAPVKSLICVGESNTLTASGGDTYLWSSQQQGGQVVVTPAVASTAIYTVTGTDVFGCKNTAVISFSVDECAGLQNSPGRGQYDIFLYPNPVRNVFTLNASSAGDFEIINEAGQVVRQLRIDGLREVTVSDLKAGIYFVRSMEKVIAKPCKLVIID